MTTWRLVQVDRTRFYLVNEKTKECYPKGRYLRDRQEAERKLAELNK